MRRYRVLLPLAVHTADASYTQGDEFDHVFTPEDEAENLRSGLLELLPLRYKVIGGSYVHGTAPGEEFDAALPIGQEALLLEGGHIERVEAPEPAPKTTTRRKKEAK